jgi:coatomer subunit beta
MARFCLTVETFPTLNDLKKLLESNDEPVKIQTMKSVLKMMLNGEPMPSLLMSVIRFIMPHKSKVGCP